MSRPLTSTQVSTTSAAQAPFLTATLNPLQLLNPNPFVRFGAKTLTFSGSGSGNVSASNTIITGNARIYTAQSDRGSVVPLGNSINSLRLSYGQTFNGERILRWVLESPAKIFVCFSS